MEYIITVIILIIWFFISRMPKTNKIKLKNLSPDSNKNKYHAPDYKKENNDEMNFLRERWHLADIHYHKGDNSIFKEWYYENATDNQKQRLDKLDIHFGKEITKGQAYDLFGIYEDPNDKDIEVLKFFKKSIKGINKTRAMHEASLIFNNEKNIEEWKNRPITQIQKEFFKFFGIKINRNMTSIQAKKEIDEYMKDEHNNNNIDEWIAFEEIIKELSDKEILLEFEIKKPNISLIKSAIERLKEEGKSYQEIGEDIDLIVDEIIKIKPDIRK